MGQWLSGLVIQSELLNLMPPSKQSAIVQVELFGQLQGRHALRKATQHQHNGGAVIMGPLPNRIGEQVEHVATHSTAVIN